MASNGTDITDGMSGGWSTTFNLSEAGDVDISFDYTYIFKCAYDAGEYSEVLMSVDGTLVGDGGEVVALLEPSGCDNSALTGSFSTTVTGLSAGVHTITLGGYNNQKTTKSESTTLTFDNVLVTTESGGGPSCSNGSIPAQIEAEDYCAFNDSDTVNDGAAAYPSCDNGDAVDIETTTDDHSPNCNVGYTVAGEYLEYNITSPGGSYDIVLRAASLRTNRQVSVTLDGAAVGSVSFSGSGWQSFADYTISNVAIPAGNRVVRVTWDTNDVNLNHLEFVTHVPGVGSTFTGRYYSDPNFGALGVTRDDDFVGFDWGSGSPDPSLPDDGFSVRWTGDIVAEYSENYTFSLLADDGVRLLVDGETVIDDLTAGSLRERTGSLPADRRPDLRCSSRVRAHQR